MRLSNKAQRVVRTVHLWVGAWGAIAAVIFGFSGFVQNHRGALKLPQGDSIEVSAEQIPVPEEARVSAAALGAWLSSTRHLQLQVQQHREGPPQAGRQGAGGGAIRSGDNGDGDARGTDEGAAQWNLGGGNARVMYQVQYVAGADTATLRTTQQSFLAVLSRLHKGVGGGIPWILLSDSFALGMSALGVSGLVMWARGRSARQMAFSAVGAAVLLLAVIGGSAVA